MSHYCTSHPRYSAKREPKSLCGQCWMLYFIKNPELKKGRYYAEWMLILFSFLPAGPGLDRPMVVKTELGPYTIEECFMKKGQAMREAKRMKEKQIGASCVKGGK